MSTVNRIILAGMNRALERENADLRSALQREISKNSALEFAFDRAFLEWCADHMVASHGIEPTAPYIVRLRQIAGTKP